MSDERNGARLRATAATVVERVVCEGRTLDSALSEVQVAESEAPLLRMLCYGTIRHHWRLRAQLAALLDRPLKTRDRVIESLLAIGLFQLTDTRVPDHAAVSMTVEAARVLRRPAYAGLINAVLRNFRRKSPVIASNEEAELNHPQWLIDTLRRDWPDDWCAIANANNERAPMWLRVNARQTTAEDYVGLMQLVENMPEARMLPGFEQALCLEHPVDVERLPGFLDGRVSVQDAAAQIAAPWLLAEGGRRILDACAAPGGKTGHLLELAAGDAAVTALDADEERLQPLKQNLRRLRLNATVVCADASNPEDWWDGEAFDRILVDAPCSATGVIRRHPDIRLLRRSSDIAGLARQQGGLLNALWPLLAPAGRLLYVTCSVLQEENDLVVQEFLGLHSDAVENTVLPNYNIRDLMRRKALGFQVLPGSAGLDGFYYACLDKDPGKTDSK
ncbi:MAG TPA: 16S rRNA (cytosine(967)-C(5))-methyltransferase RsmB [Woeseiaceae bacterium]|nr:16S rRNA (cytosine(967)-C(5))-methyltransferase RsmB [Woeseiaceae bacterium]